MTGPGRRTPRRRDERGLVLPTRLMVFSISAIALAGLVLVATEPGQEPDSAAPAAVATPTAPATTPAPTVEKPVTPPAKPKPQVRRAKYRIVVFNNSNVTGLAGKTASRAQAAGWDVVGSDNWYGTVDASTVYHGPGMKAAAELLADDLGIRRVKEAIAPMRPDRLTVILTGDYAD